MTRINCLYQILLVFHASVIWSAKTLALEAGPLVTSKVGPIQGVRANDGDYFMFLGVPYGKVDKRNPFGRSTPYPKFEKPFEAFSDSVVCPQIEEFNNTLTGSLDCLTLNIYVPTTATSSNRLPVLIFIFGGALRFGFAGRYVYGPKFLMTQDIILVTINYRLGPYGFMCLDDPEVSGNQGIKDQILALRWINKNIEDFGGDVNKITLSGQSAGAMSVDLIIHSPAEHLFQQAILESGTVLTPFLFENPGNEGPLKLAKYLGFDTDNVNKALSFLATVDTNDVISASERNNLTFKACVEKRFANVEPIVTDYPVNLLVPKVKNISILTGVSNDEEIRTYGNVDDDYLKKNDLFKKYIKAFFNLNNNTYGEMKTVLKNFYFGDKEVNTKARPQISELATDFQGVYPLRRTLRKYFDNGAKTIFSYLFSYVGNRNYLKYKNNITVGRAAHGDEIGYLYDVSFLRQFTSEEDQKVINMITTLWANFVKYGNPTPAITELLPLKWDPVTRERWNYLQIDSELSTGAGLYHRRMSFLDLFFKINEQCQIGYRIKNENIRCCGNNTTCTTG